MNMFPKFISKVMAVAMTFAFCSLQVAATVSKGQEHIIEITGFKFIPGSIEISPGDTITWINRDIAPHTATSADGSWDTGTLGEGESKTLVVDEKMSGSYLCRFHVNMTGELALVNQ